MTIIGKFISKVNAINDTSSETGYSSLGGVEEHGLEQDHFKGAFKNCQTSKIALFVKVRNG